MRHHHVDCVSGVSLLGLCSVLLWQLNDVPYEGRLFPVSVLVLLMGCSVWLALRGVLALVRDRGGDQLFSFFGQVAPRIWFIVVGVFIGYTIFAMNISFLLGTFIVGFLIPTLLTGRPECKKMLMFLIFSSGMTAFFHIFFIRILHFNFPSL